MRVSGVKALCADTKPNEANVRFSLRLAYRSLRLCTPDC